MPTLRTLSFAVLAAALLLPTAHAQSSIWEVPFRPRFEFTTQHGMLEVNLGANWVKLEPGAGQGFAERRLTHEEAQQIYDDYLIATQGSQPEKSGLVVYQGAYPPVFLTLGHGVNGGHPSVEPLIGRLTRLRDELRAAPRKTRGLQFEQDVSRKASRKVGVHKSGQVRIRYQLGSRIYSLPHPSRLKKAERRALRRAIKAFERSDSGTASIAERPTVELQVTGAGVTRTFMAGTVDGLPANALPLARVMEEILQRTFRYGERTQRGTVVDGGRFIECGPLLGIDVPHELQALTRPLEGKQVVVQALVSDDLRWSRALYLVAHDGEGGIVPIGGVGSDSAQLQATAFGVVPKLLAGANRQRAVGRSWSADALSLVWSKDLLTEVLEVANTSAGSGLAGSLED